MTKTIIISILFVVISGFTAVVQTRTVASSQTIIASLAETKVEVRVDGLSCPFCAYGLEKKLKKIDGIKDLKIDIKKGLVTFTLKEGKTVDEKTIRKIVKDAGFTPKEITFPPKNAD